MQATVVAARFPRVLVGATAVLLALLVVVAVAGTVAGSPTGRDDRIALAAVPEGVSLQHVGARAVAFVRTGDAVEAFRPPAGGSESCALREGYDVHLDDGDVLVSTSHRFDAPPVLWSEVLARSFADRCG